MAFDNTIFPYYPIKHNISKTIINPVSIVSNGAFEYRIKRQAWERYKWILPTQTMTQEQKEQIKSFLVQRNSSLNSFKFRDPDAASYINAELPLYSGAFHNAILPLSMVDQSSTNGYGNHPIFNIDTTQLTWTLNGVTQGAGINLSYTNNEPLLEFPGSIFSDTVKVSGPITFTVRLNSTIEYALIALDTNNETAGVNHAAIELIEVFGEY